MSDDQRGFLKTGEPHPASINAARWIMGQPAIELARWEEAFNSCAIEGNRLAEICAETMRRLRTGEMVSDRYVLGLAWAMQDNSKGEKDEEEGASQSSGG